MANNDFRFTSRFLNNGVFIVDGLGANDSQTGLHLYNTLRDLRDYAGVDTLIERFPVTNSGELRHALDKIEALVRDGVKPIIHFECHGSAQGGLQIGDCQDMVGWDVLEVLLRRINLASGCHLGVVMGVCHGLYAITPIRIQRPAPFYFLIGSQDEITGGALRKEMPEFYRVLFVTNNLEAAIANAPSCKTFHAEKLLAVSFAKYLKRGCMGMHRMERVDRMISEKRFVNGVQYGPEQLRSLRKQGKERTKAENQTFALQRILATFLPGRSCSFTFDELLAWVRSYKG